MMKKRILMIIVVLLMLITTMLMFGCTQADRVTYNISKQADNFNVLRQITIINCIQGDTVFQMTGRLSIQGGATEANSYELQVVVQTSETQFKKHFIGLTSNLTYIVEQLEPAEVSNYKYTLYFNPKMWLPIEIETAG